MTQPLLCLFDLGDVAARVWCLAFRPRSDVLGLARGVRQNIRVGLFVNNPPAFKLASPSIFPNSRPYSNHFCFHARLASGRPRLKCIPASSDWSGTLLKSLP